MGAPRARPVVMDAGSLIAFERGATRVRGIVRTAVDAGAQVVVPTGVLAQVWRDGSRQARLAALLRDPATLVQPLDEPSAKAAGALCGRARTSDFVDASVVVAARLRNAVVVTSDPDDLRRFDPQVEVAVV